MNTVVLLLMQVVSQWHQMTEKSNMLLHFDHCDLMNAMAALTTSLESQIYVKTMFEHIRIMS